MVLLQIVFSFDAGIHTFMKNSKKHRYEKNTICSSDSADHFVFSLY